MVDTGAAPNLIKNQNLHRVIKIEPNDKLILSEITAGKIKILGSTCITYMGHDIKVHVVDNDFPISPEGILGFKFLRKTSKIDFARQSISWQGIEIPFSCQETVVIPAMTHSVLPLRIKNLEISEGYVPRIRIEDDVYVGEAIVRNKNGRALIGIVNARDQDIRLRVPSVTLEEIEFYSTQKSAKSCKQPVRTARTPNKRVVIKTDPILGLELEESSGIT